MVLSRKRVAAVRALNVVLLNWLWFDFKGMQELGD